LNSIRVTTVGAPTASTIEGTLFTADPITNLVAINTSTSTTSSSLPSGSYRLIPISQIISFNLISLQTSPPSSTFSTALPALRPVDMTALRAREAAAIRAAHAARARLGPKGTTKEHQDIFDAIARTHPAKWQPNGSILVSDSVLIDKPYQPDNCRLAPTGVGVGGDGPARSVERIRKVLKMEREKLELKAARFDVGKASLKEGGVRKGG
jgi:hypothetical protein